MPAPPGPARCHLHLASPRTASRLSPSRRMARDLRGLGGLLIVAALVPNRISVNYYVITPGDASPVAQYIEVPAADNHPLTGKILLTDVYLTQLNAFSWLQYTYFDSNSEVISGPELLGPTVERGPVPRPGVPPDGPGPVLRHGGGTVRLGYTVTSTNAGALVYGIAPGSPAAATLHVAQVITAVNSTRHDRLLPHRRAARVDARVRRPHSPSRSPPSTMSASS